MKASNICFCGWILWISSGGSFTWLGLGATGAVRRGRVLRQRGLIDVHLGVGSVTSFQRKRGIRLLFVGGATGLHCALYSYSSSRCLTSWGGIFHGLLKINWLFLLLVKKLCACVKTNNRASCVEG